MFSRKYKDKQFFCGHNILTESVLVTQLSTNAGISVWRIVWVTTKSHFMGDIALAVLLLDNSRGKWTKLESDILPEIQMRVW